MVLNKMRPKSLVEVLPSGYFHKLYGIIPMLCRKCNETITTKRVELGYTTCLDCGDAEAKQVVHTVVPMHKSNYVVVTNFKHLVGINTK